MNRSSYRVLLAPALTAFCILLGGGQESAWAQQAVKWMSAGSLHNWFSSMGCEIEVGRSANADQQDGLQWPAWYPYQDMQAAKGLWLGVTNYTDAAGTNWPYKVVHVGPRVRGIGEFIPITFEMVSKYAPPEVMVDGNVSEGKTVENERVDPTQKPDRMIINVVNTAIGVTMTRKIMQFSNQYHDNYMIYDYTFTNTGNIDADPEIELPSQTITGLYVYYQYRYSVVADTRYVIGNPTSWGKNAMNDTRGDGFILPTTGTEDTDDAVTVLGYSAPHMRIQYVWHGKFPPFTSYDNIGGPIWVPYYDPTDTTGRLGAAQFVGHVTIHADASATDNSDDFSQPRTTSWEGSDEPNTSNNDQFNLTRMTSEYTEWMQRGHNLPRHAWYVEPAGKFDEPTGDPAPNTPWAPSGSAGGYSNADGYGPYTLAPGQSIHLVLAEGASGLSREACIRIGRWYKANRASNVALYDKAKNDSVFTGRDSLFNTFRRAIANFHVNYDIPAAPAPPSIFNVTSGDPINLSWDVDNPGDPNLTGFRIYRATGRYDAEYSPIATVGPAVRSFNDATAQRGVAYYYYISTIGNPALNTGAGLTPLDTLFSNRVYTQTFIPAYLKLKRPPGGSMSEIRIVPNPYIVSSDSKNLRFEGEPDKIAFYNIPGRCRISIYTELGEKINEILHTDGSGDEYWNSITSWRQIVVSGIYIVVFEDLDTGQRAIKKLSVIR
ncbi:MAG: hypothetical protein AB1428_14965 [Bacteroidota bacterium]